jgi:carbamoyltransferase
MLIVGINAFHGDASACILRDGILLAAAEEERFSRRKHAAGFPVQALRWCLEQAGESAADIDHIAINRDPRANLHRKTWYALTHPVATLAKRDRLSNAVRIGRLPDQIAVALNVPVTSIKAQCHHVEHHRAHMASSFFVSPFETAAVVSVDGFGDFVSAMWGVGQGNLIDVRDQVGFPHSLGLFYLAITQFLGFPNYGDEYKVMGLAPYGQPVYLEQMRSLVRLRPNGLFALGLEYFRHHAEAVSMTWGDGEPQVGRVYADTLAELLGPPRKSGEPLEQRHKNLAASAQAMYEEAFFHLLQHVFTATGETHLALSGGCAMNSVANGKIFDQTGFKDVYIQSAAGDAGGAVGSAYFVWNQVLKQPRGFSMTHSYWGPGFSAAEIGSAVAARSAELAAAECTIEPCDEPRLIDFVADAIARGLVVGWFQGRMEWGPRALGNRSILGDPRRADMKDILNLKIKRRESFRPFAPSILREATPDWFETDYDVPFMLQVFQIREEKRPLIPAVTHVNGSGRLQTVTEAQNPRYYRLISRFGEITGVPILLNTSFNENEPVVCRPEEALDCFLRTKMDVLVLGDYFIERAQAG